MVARKPIKDLYNDAVFVTAMHYEYWSDDNDSLWDYWSANRCEECDMGLVAGGTNHANLDPSSKCEGWVSEKMPVMDSFYPLPYFKLKDDPELAALALVDLPMCIVRLKAIGNRDEEWGMALCGGGMDFTWEIVEAYMRLEYLPPLVYCERLPKLAGMKMNADLQWIIAGCRRSTGAAKDRAAFVKTQVDEVAEWLKS